jgi:hypothetical protein
MKIPGSTYFSKIPEEIHSYIYKIYFINNVLEDIHKSKYKTEEDFSNYSETKALAKMYNVITDLELWKDIKNVKTELSIEEKWISKLLENEIIHNQAHSAATFSWFIQVMIKESPNYIYE